jgi:hypothetical protein
MGRRSCWVEGQALVLEREATEDDLVPGGETRLRGLRTVYGS